MGVLCLHAIRSCRIGHPSIGVQYSNGNFFMTSVKWGCYVYMRSGLTVLWHLMVGEAGTHEHLTTVHIESVLWHLMVGEAGTHEHLTTVHIESVL